MTTIISKGDYRVTFNGSKTYFIEDTAGQCYKTYNTEKAALKYFHRLLEMAGQA